MTRRTGLVSLLVGEEEGTSARTRGLRPGCRLHSLERGLGDRDSNSTG